MRTLHESNRPTPTASFPPPAAPGDRAEPGLADAGRASPDEGAALIRAFRTIRRREVRTALIELALSLGASDRPAS